MRRDKIVAVHSFPVWLPQTQTWMYTQIKHLPEAVETHVVCERTENLDQFNVPNIHSLQEISRLRAFWEKALRKLRMPHLRRHLSSVAGGIDADIIHSHFGEIGWADLEAVRLVNTMHIVSFYGYDVNMLPSEDHKWFSRYHTLFAQADLFLCEGPHMARQLVRLGCPEEKIKVHHLGVEIDNIPCRPRRWARGEPLRVLLAGTFQEKKGIPYALQALADIQRDVPLAITIIGDAIREERSQREKWRIKEIGRQSEMALKIRFLGFQPYTVLLEEAYKHHVFISPSVTAINGDTEGGAPVTLIEMMASGMPVISTAHCDIPEVVQYGIDDWLVEERDVSGLVNKLRWLVGNSGEWRELIQVGRARVEKEFNAFEQGQRLGEIYKDLLRQREGVER